MFSFTSVLHHEPESAGYSISAGAEAEEPPFIEDLSPDNVQIVRGAEFTLKGKFIAEPSPNVRWFKDKTELETGGRFKLDLIRDTSILTVTDSQPGDSGKYTLMVENELGCDTCSSSVTIEGKIQIITSFGVLHF